MLSRQHPGPSVKIYLFELLSAPLLELLPGGLQARGAGGKASSLYSSSLAPLSGAQARSSRCFPQPPHLILVLGVGPAASPQFPRPNQRSRQSLRDSQPSVNRGKLRGKKAQILQVIRSPFRQGRVVISFVRLHANPKLLYSSPVAAAMERAACRQDQAGYSK